VVFGRVYGIFGKKQKNGSCFFEPFFRFGALKGVETTPSFTGGNKKLK